VHPHPEVELDFFRKKEDLKLQLRVLELEVQQKKLEHKKAALASTKPLKDSTNTSQVRKVAKQTSLPSSTTKTKTRKSKQPASQQQGQPEKSAAQSASQSVAVPTSPHVAPAVTPRPKSPSHPPPRSTQHTNKVVVCSAALVHATRDDTLAAIKCSIKEGTRLCAQFKPQYFHDDMQDILPGVPSVNKWDASSEGCDFLQNGTGWRQWRVTGVIVNCGIVDVELDDDGPPLTSVTGLSFKDVEIHAKSVEFHIL